MTSYGTVLEKFASMPEVATNLFEPALYQIASAAIASGNAQAASNALRRILTDYPNSFHTAGALLMVGLELGRTGNPAAARAVLRDFATAVPGSDLRPQVELAIARTFEQQDKWPDAIEVYDRWLSTYTNDAARPGAEYYCAQANYLAGRETNALALFGQLASEVPTNQFTPLARWWVGDYNYRSGQPNGFFDAEHSFQLLYKSWPGHPLGYQALMMAGRAAASRQGWSDAKDYFATLWNDTNAPTGLRIEALSALGDALMSLAGAAETNKTALYGEAINAYDYIVKFYPTSQVAMPALGQKASCLVQTHDYESASNAFMQVIESPQSDVKTRSLARIGLGVALEKQAQQSSPAQTNLLSAALNNYLDVFYGKILKADEKPDPFAESRAGFEAGRLAESLHLWSQAGNIYRRLQDTFPVLAARAERNLRRAREQMAAGDGRKPE
jgi:TolA-binding protein